MSTKITTNTETAMLYNIVCSPKLLFLNLRAPEEAEAGLSKSFVLFQSNYKLTNCLAIPFILVC